MLTERPTETLLLEYSVHSFCLLQGGRLPMHYIQLTSNSINRSSSSSSSRMQAVLSSSLDSNQVTALNVLEMRHYRLLPRLSLSKRKLHFSIRNKLAQVTTILICILMYLHFRSRTGLSRGFCCFPQSHTPTQVPTYYLKFCKDCSLPHPLQSTIISHVTGSSKKDTTSWGPPSPLFPLKTIETQFMT
jgi:hypothetical protein